MENKLLIKKKKKKEGITSLAQGKQNLKDVTWKQEALLKSLDFL